MKPSSAEELILYGVVAVVGIVALAWFGSNGTPAKKAREADDVRERAVGAHASDEARLATEAKRYSHGLRRERLDGLIRFWKLHRLDRLELADAALLPYPKVDAIEDLMEIFVATTSNDLRGELFAMAYELPQYRDGVGGRRLALPEWPARRAPNIPLDVDDFLAVLGAGTEDAEKVARCFADAERERRVLLTDLLQTTWTGLALTDEWRVATFGKHD